MIATLLTILYYYLIIGVIVGCFVTYVLHRHLGLEEAARLSGADEEECEDIAKVMVWLCPILFAPTWPWFIYKWIAR